MERKEKLKYLKYAAVLLTFVVSVVVIALVKPGLSSEYTGTTILELNFSSDANLDQIVGRTDNLDGNFERIEKTNSTQVMISFIELAESEESLANTYSELEGFQSLNVQEVNIVQKDLTGAKVFALLVLPVYLGIQYIFLNNIEKGRNKVGLLFAFFMQNVFAGVVFVSILINLSRLYPLDWEIVNIFVALGLGRIVIDLLLLFKINLAAKVNSQDDFPKFIMEFVHKFDVNFVIVSLFSTIVMLPLVLISSEPIATSILLLSFIGLNILLETFIFGDLIALFYYLIKTTPVIRDLKWTKK